MADQPAFIDYEASGAVEAPPQPARPIIGVRVANEAVAQPAERKRSFLATLDTTVVVVVGMLLAIGLMMVYSTTFDWSYQVYDGNPAVIFLSHARNMFYGLCIMVALVLIDYRIWRRFAVVLLIVTFALLVGVLLFGDNTFGARRAFFNGSYQPGELAELIIIVYMAAWLGSKNAKIRSLTHGLLPYGVLVGVMAWLVMLQPDISTAAMIILVSGIMFFLAGADIMQLVVTGACIAIVAVVLLSSQRLGYAQERLDTYLSGVTDVTQASYHVQQARLAFSNGGWTGVGLGQGRQKFGFLPSPHSDSIFAVIGEELGVLGAMLVMALYVILVVRGFVIARRAPDMFGSLLAAGITIWIGAKALLNIAVMTAVLPATGAPLPFISYGGSSLLVMMTGAGLLLSVSRASARTMPEWRNQGANSHRSGGDGGTRIPRPSRKRSHAELSTRR